MESARDKAINALRILISGLSHDGKRLADDREITAAVDALIDAARSSESEHTRALDVRGTTGGKATTETSGT